MEKRRLVDRHSTEYRELNKKISNAIRKDMRTVNKEKIKAIIEESKNMKVLRITLANGRSKTPLKGRRREE